MLLAKWINFFCSCVFAGNKGAKFVFERTNAAPQTSRILNSHSKLSKMCGVRLRAKMWQKRNHQPPNTHITHTLIPFFWFLFIFIIISLSLFCSSASVCGCLSAFCVFNGFHSKTYYTRYWIRIPYKRKCVCECRMRKRMNRKWKFPLLFSDTIFSNEFLQESMQL